MRSSFAWGATLALYAAALLKLSADSRAGEPARSDESVRQKRLELLQWQVDQFEIEMKEPDRKLIRGKQPILRWSNPVREFVNDGVTFLFLEGERPRVILTVWARSSEASLESGTLFRESVSLSGQPMTCWRDGRVLWSPKAREDVDQTLAAAPSPAERPSQRLAQMRELARRFRAMTYKMGSPNELRLLTQPLYRYQDEAAGILDGALFAFAEGNDPEALLLLEATVAGDGKEHKWRYTPARMTTYRVDVRLDDRTVFAVDPYWQVARKPESPYVEAEDGPFSLRH